MDNSQMTPKARTDGLLVQELGDEVLVYDLDRHKAHCLNSTAAVIWRQCDGDKTIGQIVDSLAVDREARFPEDVVRFALAQLKKNNLLTPSSTNDLGANAISRREVIRRIGISAAIGLPLVTSVLAPRASEAATCLATGQPCTSGGQCCSTVCTGGVVCA